MTQEDVWTLELVDGDLELPGWLHVPGDMSPADREQWLADSTADLVGSADWDGELVTAEQAREVLQQGLEQRAASDSLVMLQVWPTLAGHAAMCHIDILPSDALPSWTEGDAVVHLTDSPHLGPGLQCVTSRTTTVSGVDEVDVTSVHFIFDNGQVTVMLSLDETLTPLVSVALPALLALMQSLRVVNAADGTAFAGRSPAGVLDEKPWDFEATS